MIRQCNALTARIRSNESGGSSTELEPKPPSKVEGPQEPFKRAVAGCMRALAKAPSLEVVYRAGAPEPDRRPARRQGAAARTAAPLDAREAAILRGHADSMALRLACHNSEMHRRLSPQVASARAAFDAVEQARVEAIGARRMAGRRRQSRRHARRPFPARPLCRCRDPRGRADRGRARDDRARAPDRPKPPPNAQRMVDLWRALVEEKAGADLDRLGAAIEDQRAFAHSVHRLLSSLEMIENRASTTRTEDDEGETDDVDEGDADTEGDDGEDDQTPDAREMEKSEAAAEATDDSEDRCRRRADRRIRGRGRLLRFRTGRRSEPTAAAGRRPEQRGPDYKAFTKKFDEVIAAEDLCDARGAGAAALLSRQAAATISHRSWRGSPTACSGA